MADSTFTAYIFREDLQKLQREAGSAEQKSGSLFGQWTSTGNPVVHYAVPSAVDRADSETYGTELWNGYRLCHIGEWRSIRHFRPGQSVHDDGRHLLSKFKGGKPRRFLVLDVGVTNTEPYLFESESRRRKGEVEPLRGENPFNRPDVDPQQLFGRQHHHLPQNRVEQSPATQGHYRPLPPPSPQEAVTATYQWYSVPGGNDKLQRAFEEFKQIAYQSVVNMSRDTATQNLSMSFKDRHHLKKWQVDFPPTFPKEGAVLIENPDLRNKKMSPQASNTTTTQAVKKLISCIQRSSFM